MTTVHIERRRLGVAAGVGLALLGGPRSIAAAPGRAVVDTVEARSPRNANYTIQARLDPDAKTISGTQVLTWTNITDSPTSELRYHLYYNAWRNDRSSWFRTGIRSRQSLASVPDDGWAYSDVESVGLLQPSGERHDLTAGARFVAPDDHNPDDRTVLAVPLPNPVAPGETIRVELAWVSKVPRTFARTGFRGDYYFLGQWFPKVGVLEADGEWNCHQFIQTEFYSDFGVYDVALTVPTGWVVGASGKQQGEASDDAGMATHRFVAHDVHDFAWTTSPDFSVHTERFEHEGLPSVDMRLLLMPDHSAYRERYLEATAAALEHYGKWWGPYPYDHITVVDPAYKSGSAGMEYPTLFTGGTRWLSPEARRSPEGVTVHEAGHQFWYGIVANNEFEYAWLDEGFNTYSTTRTMEAAFPDHAHVEYYFDNHLPVVFPSVIPPERTAGSDKHVGLYSSYKRDPQGRNSYQTGPGGYHVNAYDKGSMTLRTLENYLGWTTFQQLMSTYFGRYAFGHPRPEDFVAVAESVSGRELSWFFDQLQNDSVVFDYAVGRVQSEPVVARGYDATGRAQPNDKPNDKSDGDASMYEHHVYVRRWGEGVFPVAVQVDFEDGTRKTATWDGEDRWVDLAWEHPAKVERVRVDPDHVLVLDTNFSNNSWLAQSRAPLAATKWSSKWMIFVQHTMEALAILS